jgi:predicted DNA-binding ribbon-helix-helix protein
MTRADEFWEELRAIVESRGMTMVPAGRAEGTICNSERSEPPEGGLSCPPPPLRLYALRWTKARRN